MLGPSCHQGAVLKQSVRLDEKLLLAVFPLLQGAAYPQRPFEQDITVSVLRLVVIPITLTAIFDIFSQNCWEFRLIVHWCSSRNIGIILLYGIILTIPPSDDYHQFFWI